MLASSEASMEDELKQILEEAKAEIDKVQSLNEFDTFKAKFVGSHGRLIAVSKGIDKLSAEERPKAGKSINITKGELEAILGEKLRVLEEKTLAEKIGPAIDPTLPSPETARGIPHPLTQTSHRVNDIFRRIGFSITEGPEIESEWCCFDALNTPEDHPARAEQDTLYLKNDTQMGNVFKKGEERYVMRTHTSSVQIQTLLKEKPPLRIIAPGRAFRRDTVDATHSSNFHQVEGLFVNKDITVVDLKATLDYFIEEFFGKDVKTRLRPSFFPFTEPSFEMDFCSPNLGKLSNQWIEIMGCGTVDPEVFKSVDLDPEEWSGFAFGMGIERIAMLSYGIDDIRHFYQNDLRFLKQFS